MVDVNFLKSPIVHEFINQILCMEIDKRINFNDMNYGLMQTFMDTKINSRNDIMNHLGDNAHLDGDSTAITGQVQRPSYTNGMNYLDKFATVINSDERAGINTPRTSQITSSDNPYPEVVNLYPDDLDNGKNFHKWSINGNDSILYKTKKLFKEKKINTIISRFGTSADNGGRTVWGNGDSRTEYGMSHGRNLLQAAVEKGNENGYNINGYNNPYCRVWTHHYQYDRLDKLIRPFVTRTSNGITEVAKLENIHTWKGFEGGTYVKNKTGKDENGNDVYVYKEIKGWKSGDDGWKKSVLDDTGFVKITPKYMGGGPSNMYTHTKDCMFSIENLAWKGYDPYSFEQALSWEQRGPLGGRIMWFPPYGLSFNETTQTNWSSNTFIGRGEDVYTYVNTVRSGTLSFIMLTDHPSVIDYANWYDGKPGEDNLTDTDILRFFAGCDSGDTTGEYSIFSKVKPTPLTDEYIKQELSGTNEIVRKLTPNPEPVPEEIPDSEAVVQFHVFYPNNYSGVYDMPTNQQSPVHAIAYLLKGKGSQKQSNGMEDMAITFDNLDVDNAEGRTGTGYEMGGSGISNVFEQNRDGNYILGSKIRWANYKSKNYVVDKDKKWYYRTDGKYEVPSGSVERIKNTYDQVLYDSNRKITTIGNTNYQDIQGFSLNKSADAVKQAGFSSENDEDLYSLLEVAAAAANYSGKMDTYTILLSEVSDESRVQKIINILNTYKIDSISIDGYSNSHGYNPNKKVNYDRNRTLSIERGNTVKNWLKECGIISDNTTVTYGEDETNKSHIGVQVNKGDEHNNSAKSAKRYRSTKVTIHFRLDETEKLSDTNGEEESGTTVYQKYKDFTYAGKNQVTGKEQYKDKDGIVWFEDSDGFLKHDEVWHSTKISERNTLDMSKETNEYGRRLLFYQQNSEAHDSNNNLRYDQEYYFYKKLEKDNPIVFDKLTEKLKYFDPAFHSMTPEGFTERLTFLNQCTRQGNTISASDGVNGKTASNLAFGRPPFCVLRIGDFYYQTIVIDSINIDYNVSGGLQWDLNPEGTGVQPMLAQINISFKFIGGGDLGGPIRRLQNAMTFNYYANSRLHDNRADRISYKWDDRNNGAVDHSVETDKSYAYTTKMAD